MKSEAIDRICTKNKSDTAISIRFVFRFTIHTTNFTTASVDLHVMSLKNNV